MNRVSETATPWAVVCTDTTEDIGEDQDPLLINGCGKVYMTEEEYMRQLMRPHSTWTCPNGCHNEAYFDDEHHETFVEQPTAAS